MKQKRKLKITIIGDFSHAQEVAMYKAQEFEKQDMDVVSPRDVNAEVREVLLSIPRDGTEYKGKEISKSHAVYVVPDADGTLNMNVLKEIDAAIVSNKEIFFSKEQDCPGCRFG